MIIHILGSNQIIQEQILVDYTNQLQNSHIDNSNQNRSNFKQINQSRTSNIDNNFNLELQNEYKENEQIQNDSNKSYDIIREQNENQEQKIGDISLENFVKNTINVSNIKYEQNESFIHDQNDDNNEQSLNDQNVENEKILNEKNAENQEELDHKKSKLQEELERVKDINNAISQAQTQLKEFQDLNKDQAFILVKNQQELLIKSQKVIEDLIKEKIEKEIEIEQLKNDIKKLEGKIGKHEEAINKLQLDFQNIQTEEIKRLRENEKNNKTKKAERKLKNQRALELALKKQHEAAEQEILRQEQIKEQNRAIQNIKITVKRLSENFNTLNVLYKETKVLTTNAKFLKNLHVDKICREDHMDDVVTQYRIYKSKVRAFNNVAHCCTQENIIRQKVNEEQRLNQIDKDYKDNQEFFKKYTKPMQELFNLLSTDNKEETIKYNEILTELQAGSIKEYNDLPKILNAKLLDYENQYNDKNKFLKEQTERVDKLEKQFTEINDCMIWASIY